MRQPLSNEPTLWVVVLGLLDGVVDPGGIDASGARLHLHLTPMYAGLVVEKLPRKPLPHGLPVQPEWVGRHRHQHG